jgi:hypothetical protein
MEEKVKAEIESAVKSQQLKLRYLLEKISLQEQKNLMLREENKQSNISKRLHYLQKRL